MIAFQTALFEAICENPDDDAPRLVFADWLEEHGDSERAEFIRVQCELAQLSPSDPRQAELEARQWTLLGTSSPVTDGWVFAYNQHPRPEWVGPTPGSLPFVMDTMGKEWVPPYWRFQRGFVEGVCLDACGFLEKPESYFRMGPLRTLHLTVASHKSCENMSPNVCENPSNTRCG